MLEFLGFTVSSTELELRLPTDKIWKIKSETQRIHSSMQVDVRKLLESIAGKVISKFVDLSQGKEEQSQMGMGIEFSGVGSI